MQRTMFDTFAYILHVLSMVIISSQMFPGGVSLRTVFIIKFSGWIWKFQVGNEIYFQYLFENLFQGSNKVFGRF